MLAWRAPSVYPRELSVECNNRDSYVFSNIMPTIWNREMPPPATRELFFTAGNITDFLLYRGIARHVEMTLKGTRSLYFSERPLLCILETAHNLLSTRTYWVYLFCTNFAWFYVDDELVGNLKFCFCVGIPYGIFHRFLFQLQCLYCYVQPLKQGSYITWELSNYFYIEGKSKIRD